MILLGRKAAKDDYYEKIKQSHFAISAASHPIVSDGCYIWNLYRERNSYSSPGGRDKTSNAKPESICFRSGPIKLSDRLRHNDSAFMTQLVNTLHPEKIVIL